MPEIYAQLLKTETALETHYKDMQDIEFTMQEGKLWLLQTRSGKRAGPAMVRIAVEMLKQGLIDEKTALMRVTPDRLNELLYPGSDLVATSRGPRRSRTARPRRLARATGQIVFLPTKPKSGSMAART